MDPARWADLEEATAAYVAAPATQALFAEAAAALAQVRGGGRLRGRARLAQFSQHARDVPHLTRHSIRIAYPFLRPQADAGPASAGDAAQGDAAAPTDVRLGARRRLVVLRAPRLGASQHAGVADAVAASLAHRAGCAAAINLQQLGGASPPDSAGPDLQLAEAAAQRAAWTTLGSGGVQPQAAAPMAVPAPAGERGEAPPNSSQQEAAGAEAEGESGGLTAYLSSWFGSPTKLPVLSPPAGGATAPAGGAGAPHSLRPASRQGSTLLEAAVAAGAFVSPRGTAPEVTAGASGTPAAAETGAAAAAAADLAAELEERLEPLLPSVGVLHLGLELAGGAGAVMRWRQRLQVVAEPSE